MTLLNPITTLSIAGNASCLYQPPAALASQASHPIHPLWYPVLKVRWSFADPPPAAALRGLWITWVMYANPLFTPHQERQARKPAVSPAERRWRHAAARDGPCGLGLARDGATC